MRLRSIRWRLPLSYAAIALLAALATPFTLAGSAGALQVQSYQLVGDTVHVTVANQDDRPHAGFLAITVVKNGEAASSVQKVTVEAAGTIDVSVGFGSGVTAVVSVDATDGPDPM